MCGYSGIVFCQNSLINENLRKKDDFLEAASKLSHRGKEPIRTEFFNSVYLSHFRLAFQDLLSNVQPMLSINREWAIVFNGEIYNFKILREKIKKDFNYNFLTHGDTEVILAGFLNYGKEIINHLDGEYSFVICRTDGSELFAARDPFGVKPLYFNIENINTNLFSLAQNKYSFQTKSLQFASEIKGLVSRRKWDKEGFLRQFTGLFEPIRTPFENVIQLPPHSYLYSIKQNEVLYTEIHLKKEGIRRNYSSNTNVFKNENIFNEFSDHLSGAVKSRLISDVDIGVYLSGGIDSKVIAYELSEHYKKSTSENYRVKSFTVSFTEKNYDESEEALKFANKFNFSPHVLKINNENLNYAYPIAVYYSENIQPYTNGAAKWWLSRFTSQYVDGVLTGDGADELLCGYPSFRYANWWKFAMRNRKGQNVFAKLKNYPLGSNWRDSVYLKKFYSHTQEPWLSGSSSEGTGDDFVDSLNIWGVPHPLFGQIKTIAIAILGENEAYNWLKKQRDSVASWFSFGLESHDSFLLDPENALLLWQNYFCHTHLPVQVLNWVGDRMEMANTLEGRTPFLAKQLNNYISGLQDKYLVNGFTDKYILRHAYEKKLGAQFSYTPKKQFGAPLWNSNENKNAYENIIEAVKDANFLDLNQVKSLLQQVENNSYSNESNHVKTHLQSAVQTLNCFSFVHNGIVKNIIPHRNEEYEQNILRLNKRQN